MAKHVRWHFNVGKWKPTRDEWLTLTSSIAGDEVTRINQFVYQDDAKSSLIGRALIRKFVSNAIKRPSNELQFIRTAHGRPIITKEYKDRLGDQWPPNIDFNVSHSGDYCVLAGLWSEDRKEPQMTVGVDVNRIISKGSKAELERFIRLMAKKLSETELDTVENVSDERQKCINFTRLWCLKESFIKSVGLGLTFDLQRIDFRSSESTKYHLSPRELRNKIMADTKVIVDGKPANDWRFLETALDEEHLVAVGYQLKDANISIQDCDNIRLDASPFVELSVESLIGGLEPLTEIDDENWTRFSTRKTKSF